MRRYVMNMPRYMPTMIIAALGILVSLPAFVIASDMSPKQLFSTASQSIGTVLTYHADPHKDKQGSAVAIAPHVMVTNCHVISGGESVRIKYRGRIVDATRLHSDEERDLCTLEAKNLGALPAKIGKVARVSIGDRVYAIGNPSGLELTFTDGLVSGFREHRSGRVIQTSAAISAGSSGGGLFNAAGELVGVTTSGVRGGQLLGFAMPADWIALVPARHSPPRTTRRTFTSYPPLQTPGIVRRLPLERTGDVRPGLAARYADALRDAIARNWTRPDNVPAGWRCRVVIRQIPGGEVISATADSKCDYADAGKRSLEAAVLKAQPLPYVGFESVFQRSLGLDFRDED